MAERQISYDQAEMTRSELDARDITISEMKRMMDSLETELQHSVSREQDLRKVPADIRVG